jgi:hypothetical protein
MCLLIRFGWNKIAASISKNCYFSGKLAVAVVSEKQQSRGVAIETPLAWS